MKELIRDMAAAFQQVHEKNMDPVDKKAVKKDYDDREDKDIDNDGDTDSSDRYLHKRRKAVTKAVHGGKGKAEVETDVQEKSKYKEDVELDELSKKKLGQYVKKASNDKVGSSEKMTRSSIGAEDPKNPSSLRKHYSSERDKAARKLGKRTVGINKAIDRMTKEDVELDELSQDKLKGYYAKAGADMQKSKKAVQRHMDAKKISKGGSEKATKAYSRFQKRVKGLGMAADKMKEENSSPLARYKSMLEMDGQMARDENKADGEPNTKQQAAKPNPPEKHQKVNPAVAKEGESSGRKDVAEESMVDRVMGIFKEDQMKMDKITGQPGQEMKSGTDMNQKTAEKSKTPDTGKLDKKQAPDELDAEDAIDDNRKAEVKSANAAKSANKGGMTESYSDNNNRYVDQLLPLANEIVAMAKAITDDHKKAMAAADRVSASYASNKDPSQSDIKLQSGRMYDAKMLVRSLADCRDALETNKREVRESVDVNVTVEHPSAPNSIRSALTKMAEANRAERYKGATKSQTYDDNWSGEAKAFADKHKVQEPDYVDINKVTANNKTEVGASLARSVNYRPNDQKIGDKTQPGAEKLKGKTT